MRTTERQRCRLGVTSLAGIARCIDHATLPQSFERLLGLFDRLDELVANDDFRGCRNFASDVALEDPDHPAHAETEGFRRRLRERLMRELEAMDHADPERAADQLHLLIEGTLVMGATQDDRHPARAARDMAALILGRGGAPWR
ncbi:hypothetical protein [Actinopolymorpha alba]|uniref:hypothetical protein n=1 Tax=Actinopolymorpha alba TaxID=533267 RepID=UPI0003696FF4|nr:hypothetical protein [Actinopolymorpha alba]